ncbi:hydroxymethylglutaryl-CoA reductase, degradative [Winogradskyella sp. PC-19]|uniref:hydroxymethylglutaryl-CoA reductase, degradative n=1 Tax=unclassified Winogradskyella TaxID=2615021 RepID=UPI000B3C9BDF|nr:MULTISPECIES: hydroxymethylglutaryl-CoA reductase, degradative [unclassified Winogradskyella]ARV10154.1 hydroxymethylglutaryl-CoA reductase, degradative [Winogradskyella sp. PC-19]RZN82753.1 MAG: hydroxymethylglutaryl-CoA reductase, degradative [Winogradskyella sp.]
MHKTISGFSKLTKTEKVDWILKTYFNNDNNSRDLVTQYWNSNQKLQKLHDEFIENTITNFYLPLGVAPNFLINDTLYTIPMTIEESSVVAAASKAAKFWYERGGFKAEVISTTKIGQVHFTFNGDKTELENYFNTIKSKLISDASSITKNMERRGGGILDIELRDKTKELDNYYQLHATFETLDAMGANFINSCLEQFAETFKNEAKSHNIKDLNIVMSILSNYVPQCLVRAEVSCKISDLKDKDIPNPEEFAEKFKQAVSIAEVEPHRAVTHNKGIMNGIDAVVLATGNDFRAVEAGVHAYASKDGKYSSLTRCRINDDTFTFWLEIPLALGTVGGLTSLHPLVKFALQLLGKPSAKDLMKIVAVAGLAQNFAALKSLTTTGIQQGHMKMHLMNILNQFEANDTEKKRLIDHFKNNTVTHNAVVEAIEKLRA